MENTAEATEEDFMKVVGEYMAFKLKQILTNNN